MKFIDNRDPKQRLDMGSRVRVSSVHPLLRTGGLSVTYRPPNSSAREALKDVNLFLGPGEVTGIIGPSGAGKSTLALALLHALPREADVAGEIYYAGRSMAPVFQEPSSALHPMLSAGRQVAEAARARRGWEMRRCREEAEFAFELAGLDPRRFFGAWPHQLSGGERQRVMIAQAIAGRPELIIADEPTASLDAASAAGIMRLLKDLRSRLGMALIFITHSPRLLSGFADRVLTICGGRIAD